MAKLPLPNENVTEAVSVGDAYENAHAVQKGNPKVDGPYLDDIRAAQEEEYRRQRTADVSQIRDEDVNKKKDVPYEVRAASQVQHDENRYHEEKTVEESVKAHKKKTPKTAVEKAGEENRSLPATRSRKKAVKKADKYTGKDQRGDTPNLKVRQKAAKTVSDRPTQPSNETKPFKVVESPKPEVTTDPVAVKKTAQRKGK